MHSTFCHLTVFSLDNGIDLLLYLFFFVPLHISVHGGRCGLAAAVMALRQLGRSGGDVTVTSLLEEARGAGMTAQGEMFSACDLARLAGGRLAPGPVPETTARVRSDLDQPAAVLGAVLRGDAVLVPYPLSCRGGRAVTCS